MTPPTHELNDYIERVKRNKDAEPELEEVKIESILGYTIAELETMIAWYRENAYDQLILDIRRLKAELSEANEKNEKLWAEIQAMNTIPIAKVQEVIELYRNSEHPINEVLDAISNNLLSSGIQKPVVSEPHAVAYGKEKEQ